MSQMDAARATRLQAGAAQRGARAAAGVARMERTLAGLRCGSVRDALHQLLRLSEDLESAPEERALVPELARHVATLYAVLGYEEDAVEWFGRAHRQAVALRSDALLAASDALRAALSHLSGNYVATIRFANHRLGSLTRRDADPHRNLLLAVLAASYLRLGQIVKAEQCVDAIMRASARHPGELGVTLGLLVKGDLHLWSIVRACPVFRGQLLFVDEMGARGPDNVRLAALAEEAFSRALEAGADFALLRAIAQAGLIRTRLILDPEPGDWHWLEQHAKAMADSGIAHERDATRLHLAVLRLMHGNASQARHWLAPLVSCAMARPGTPFEHDVLFCAAIAAERSGDARNALAYLSEYNARIRAQHLSRVAVPPPNLERDAAGRLTIDVRRRRGDYDGALVARVSALVREQPSAPTHSLQLAAMAGISRRTLEYAFRRATGKSPKEFITAIRLEQAYEALDTARVHGRGGLAALAKSTGFTNYRSFVRAFRQAYGMSPSQAIARSRDAAERGY